MLIINYKPIDWNISIGFSRWQYFIQIPLFNYTLQLNLLQIIAQMIKVKDIVYNLPKKHAELIAGTLRTNATYSELSLILFESFRDKTKPEEIKELIKLSFDGYKIHEKTVLKAVLSFYKQEALTVRDLMLSKLFFTIYGTLPKESEQHKKDLINAIEDLKYNELDELGYPLAKKLVSLDPDNTDFQLIKDKYQNIHISNLKAFELYKDFNCSFNNAVVNSTDFGDCTRIIESIRNTAIQQKTNTINCIVNMCTISLDLVSNKDDLSKTSILLSDTEKMINDFPFGMERYYIGNIFKSLYLLYERRNGRKHYKNNVLEDLNSDANCFKFPIKKIISLSEQDDLHIIPQDTKVIPLKNKTTRLLGIKQLKETFSFEGRYRAALFNLL